MTREKFEQTQFKAGMFFKIDTDKSGTIFRLIAVDFENYTLGTDRTNDGDSTLDWVAYGICELCTPLGNPL